MKITIDTKEDSHTEIRKAIQLLNNLLEGRGAVSSRNIFDDPSPTVGGMGMFDEKPSSPPSNAFSSMFGGETPIPAKNYDDENSDTDNDFDGEKSDDEYEKLAKDHHIQFY
ncbi:hypothetical protein COV11_02490 [Candidatus Woesearchaeota archaeon CG10_big_fil_rev_8_21_14_0_10_30_7]|nr:MAG: hypothetical protein COV11_02490 [Candidatus Woesearchaeota archaeon CG10_big_fil_rev_8_21_14_0_10_30_7]